MVGGLQFSALSPFHRCFSPWDGKSPPITARINHWLNPQRDDQVRFGPYSEGAPPGNAELEAETSFNALEQYLLNLTRGNVGFVVLVQVCHTDQKVQLKGIGMCFLDFLGQNRLNFCEACTVFTAPVLVL